MIKRATAFLLMVLFLSLPAHADSKKWFQTKRFWITFGLQTAAMTADFVTTQQAERRGGLESNGVYGSHPSNARLYGTGLPLEFIVAYGSYKASQDKSKAVRSLSYILPAVVTFSSAHAAWHNTTVGPHQ